MVKLLEAILNLVGGLITPLLFYMTGKKSEELNNVKEQIEVLQAQRDNDISNVHDADQYWLFDEDTDHMS